MNRKIVIAVDGPAGSGKSSISRVVAAKKDLKYIDSGAVYRAITWHVLDSYGSVDGDAAHHNDLGNIGITQEFSPDGQVKTFIGNRDVSMLIRDEKIAANIGTIADSREIRNFVNTLLRGWADKDSVIMDGRDVGTVIFPTADLKIYLDASADIRALRRIKEYRELGKNVDENSVKKQIIQRDSEDTSRKFGALIKAEDAIYLDTTTLTKDEVIDRIIELITIKI